MDFTKGKHTMKISNFYDDEDMPSETAKKRMWSSIKSSLPNKKVTVLTFHRRSFVYGMVSSVVLFLCAMGVYTSYERFVSSSEQPDIKTNKAYQVAIKEFERAVPTSDIENNSGAEILEERKKHIALIDEEIVNVHKELSLPHEAELRQSELRRLYRMKLSILLNMVENGEMEL